MRKGFLGSMVLALGLIFGFCVSFCFAEESITITTYYPSPYGVYSSLRLYPKIIDVTESCSNAGEMFYHDTDKTVYLCDGEDWVDVLGPPLSFTNRQVFTRDGTFTVPPRTRWLKVQMWGGGGAGGACAGGGIVACGARSSAGKDATFGSLITVLC